MEVKAWTYEEFPSFDEPVEGVTHLPTTGDEAGSSVFTDVKYCEIGGTELHLEFVIPENRNHNLGAYFMGDPNADESKRPKYPCIAFVRGSGWGPQMMHLNLSAYARLAERGYIVAAVEYRHNGIAAFPAPIVDARNAVRYLRSHAREWFIDPDQIFLGGDSSGGHTCLYAGLYQNDDDPEENLFPGVSASVKGIIALFPACDFTFPDSNPTTVNHNQPDSPEGKEMGGADLNAHPELAEKLTVRTNITAKTDYPPCLLFHGSKDRTVNCRCSVKLYEHLKSLGKEVSLYILDGADHGGAEFWTDEVVDIEDRFLKKCMNK